MALFSFDLTTSSHELLREGIVAGRFFGSEHNHQRVTIEADSWLEASELAILMGMCFGYVTGCYYREWEEGPLSFNDPRGSLDTVTP